ncbi:MAG: cadherin repeat domain-containing protein [Eggerthellaceae bacterium]|nr:cadherin repeat domain-containing protein [Eggerthellaceae bacterium]
MNGRDDWYSVSAGRWFTEEQILGSRAGIADTYTKGIGIGGATVSGIVNKTYNGKAQVQSPTVKLGPKALSPGVDYKLSYRRNVNAGVATVIVVGNGKYAGTISRTFKIAKAANPLKIAKATRTVKAAKVEKAKKVVLGAKVKKKGQGRVTYSIKKVNKKRHKNNFAVNKKTGKITVKKGTPKGTYKVTVKAVAAGNANYLKSKAKTAVVTVKVR